jgi:hypothetical protein
MFVERYGKFCFTRMNPFIFFSLLIFPILLSAAYLFLKKTEFEELDEYFISTLRKGRNTIEKNHQKQQFLNRYSESDPYFINQKVESLNFLQKEQEELKKLAQHPAIANKKKFKERLNFLLSQENRLIFAEENVLSSANIKETEEKQRHPVQLNREDLEYLLCLIENVSNQPSTSPQLIIRNFHLKKRNPFLHKEVLEVEMELLKREWIQ